MRARKLSPADLIRWAVFLPTGLAFALGVPKTATAQFGDATDIITGEVSDENGNPVAGAVVEALSLETQIARTAETDARGRYTILFPDGGGQYRMTARRIGMAPVQGMVTRYADEDRLVWNARLSSQPFMLAPIEVEARLAPVRIPELRTPGSTERNLLPDIVQNLPIDPEDLNVLATLVPGVVGLDGTDSSGAAFSVVGQRPDANAITLDGMTFDDGNVPQEGLRRTRVITNTYDVSRGRFSGGLIAATTRGGTNQWQGSAGYSLRDDDLAVASGETTPFTSGFTLHRISGGVGGPIVANRLFTYVSAQGRLRSDPVTSLTTAAAADLERLGVAPDSVDRFITIASAIGASGATTTTDSRSNDNLSALVRTDYLVSNHHTLTVRGDYRRTIQDPTRISPFGLPETGGETGSRGGGVMARIASRIGVSVLNDARVYVAGQHIDGSPFAATPQGRVQVASDLADGSVGIRTLVLGGNTRLPFTSSTTTVELANELSWLPGAGSHRLRIGGLVTSQSRTESRAANQLGAFTYTSLAELETGVPAVFRRTLAVDQRNTHGIEYAAYAGDVWRASSRLQLTYGVRVEGVWFRHPPAYNPALDSALGLRTDRLPSELFVSPRAGFTWTIGGSRLGGRPDLIVTGGAGTFRSPVPMEVVALTQVSTGLPTSESEITCIGPGVPVPDWPGYVLDGTLIPTTCNGGPTSAGRAPTATVVSDEFAAPRAWRTSLGVQRNLTAFLRALLDLSYARGTSQYGFRDRNLNSNPAFALVQEAGRPVFVPASRIVPATGAVRLLDSRLTPGFAQVLEIPSALESETKQATLGLAGFFGRGILLQTSYTWASVRDQSSSTLRLGTASFASPTTGGNPNVAEWSRGDFERRHQLLATVSYPFGTALEITAIGRLTSGVPYTPLVASDINGDGERNDRAFVFAPGGTTPPDVADAMNRLLASASSGARDCLARQLGAIAARNSCTGPWEGSLDLQVNYRPSFLGLNGKLVVSVVTLNLLRGIDDLLHGDAPHGWGLRARPDETLLYVTGFDPTAQAFTYAVNERFGATRANGTALRAPFQIGIQARFSFGPDRTRDAIDRLRGGGGGPAGARGGAPGRRLRVGAGAGGFTPDDFLDRFRSLFPNPAGIVLEFRDSIALTAEQVTALEAERGALTTLTDSLATELRAELEALGANSDPRELMARTRPKSEIARNNLAQSWRRVRGLLTSEQWEMLPEGLRNARNRQARPRRPPDG